MTKGPKEYFADWEAHVFGYGYGTGENYTIAALKSFMAAVGKADRPFSYDYEKLEAAVTPTVAWLLINTLCHADIIEYGTSPRYGWLTKQGEALKVFVDGHTTDQLFEAADRDENYYHCYPDGCNCGPNGYEAGRKCGNPFWNE